MKPVAHSSESAREGDFRKSLNKSRSNSNAIQHCLSFHEPLRDGVIPPNQNYSEGF